MVFESSKVQKSENYASATAFATSSATSLSSADGIISCSFGFCTYFANASAAAIMCFCSTWEILAVSSPLNNPGKTRTLLI